MIECIKKVYELDFKVMDKRYSISYTQMNMYDCIEFNHNLTKPEFDIYKWIEDFIKDWWAKIKKKDYRCIDTNKMLEAIFSTAMKWFYEKKKWWWWKPYPFEAYIALLSEKLNIDPTRLLKEYTPEQITYYAEWVIYNWNEQSKEWQAQNKKNQAKKEMNEEHTAEEALQIAKDLEKRLKSKQK